jgi:hypothetical protein
MAHDPAAGVCIDATMKAYSILIGSPNTTRRIARREERALQTIVARHFPNGFTILDAKGAWHDARRRSFRKEDARQVLVCTAQPRKLAACCRELGAALRQQEIVVFAIGAARRFVLPKRPPGKRVAVEAKKRGH